MKVWDTTSGREERTLKRHFNGVTSLAFSPDGQTLVLRGYIGFSLLGRDETWTRAPDTAISQIDPAIIAKYLPAQATAMKQPAGKKAAPTAARH